MNPVLVHFHIYKNAGTTIDWILQKEFVNKAHNLDDFDDPGRIIEWDIILDFLSKYKNSKSISSHQIRFPLPKNDDFQFFPMLFIRNPISRIFSIYEDQKRLGGEHELSIKAKSLSPNEFFKWCFNSENKIMENSQIIFLQHKDFDVKKLDLKFAKKMISDSAIIGITERLDESLVLAEDVLQERFGKIDFSYVKQNVNPNKKNNVENKNENILEENIMNELVDRNKLDMEIHSFTEKELDKRLEKIENLEKKLVDFKNRCNTLTKNPPDVKIRSEIGIEFIKKSYY